MTPKTPKPFEIHSAEEWIRDYRAGAEHYVVPTLDPSKVPDTVRCLLDIAAEWGIPDDVTRNDKIDRTEFATVASAYKRLKRHHTAFMNYRDEIGEKVLARQPITTEERCFLYLSPFYAEADGHVRHGKPKK